MQLSVPGFEFRDLFLPHRLAELLSIFLRELSAGDPVLAARLEAYHKGISLTALETSQLLVDAAPHVSSFIARLFGVESDIKAMQLRAERDSVIFRVKKKFVTRRVLKKFTAQSVRDLDGIALEREFHQILALMHGIPHEDRELELAAGVEILLEHERFLKVTLPNTTRQALLDLADRARKQSSLHSFIPQTASDNELKRFLSAMLGHAEAYLAWLCFQGGSETSTWALLRVPHPLDYQHLVETQPSNEPAAGAHTGRDEALRRRDGFNLTDQRYSLREIESEVDYCIFCHDRDKDSCAKGILTGEGYATNPLGYSLRGCPLDQKISESHFLMSRGDALGALAIIMVDNPMVPGTGHRICNDCMKSCIYQKQDPVNIPQIETRILTEVLNLPYGFEIYSLLTRWNPLNASRPHALPYNGMNILVVGLGPAGYTLAHYFLNDGFGVVAVDGLKIEPLSPSLVGDMHKAAVPVKEFSAIREELSQRVLAGFGGVSEYGITVRWDKNFLTVLHLNLMRRDYFKVYDGIRFGGTLTVEDAWQYGFDHVCFASGAGKPTFVSMKNNLMRGIRKASDFLMALQLTGAGKTESMANLQVRLPAVVIGGGLTAIDTATELMAYYPVQVTKIKHRYDALVTRYGHDHVDGMFDAEEKGVLEEFIRHADAINDERRQAATKGDAPNFLPLVRSWGGVHIYYRKSMVDSPAYRLNHEEIIKGLEEGISFVECMSPLEAVPDEYGAVKEMIFERMNIRDGKWKSTEEKFRIQARTVMVAAGTVPNVMYEREHPGTFELDDDGEFFRTFSQDNAGEGLVPPVKGTAGFFTSYEFNGKYVTFYGDTHPEFAGNVVRAMASAKQGYRDVLALLERKFAASRGRGIDQSSWTRVADRLERELRASVVSVKRLTPTITEVIVRAPKAAREFHPGQFYRLQNYEVDSVKAENTLLLMEGLALTGAWVDKEEGTIGLITLEVGASSRMCALLKPGQRVVVMGPTGCPTDISENGTALLLGGGLGNAVLFSIAKALKAKNNTVIYFAGYKRKEDLFRRKEIESATDIVVYSVDAGESIETRRPSDRSFVGNIVEAMLAYARGELGPVTMRLNEADRIIAIGSDRMMAAVARARHEVLKPYLREEHIAIASINSSMQCMMKAVCAQCVQRHINPATGKEEFVFTCVNQDQLMDEVDFNNLSARLKTNGVMEKITNLWLDFILDKHDLPRV